MTVETAEASGMSAGSIVSNRKILGSAEVVALQTKKNAPVSNECFQAVDDILDRLTERAHRAAGF